MALPAARHPALARLTPAPTARSVSGLPGDCAEEHRGPCLGPLSRTEIVVPVRDRPCLPPPTCSRRPRPRAALLHGVVRTTPSSLSAAWASYPDSTGLPDRPLAISRASRSC